MPPVDTGWTVAAVVAVYLLVIVLPGVAVGVAAGLRGWSVAALAPLLSYAVWGLSGPWLHLIGVPFTVVTAAVCAVLITAAVYGLRRGLGRGAGTGPDVRIWSRQAHVAVSACVGVAFVLSVSVLVGAAEGVPDAIFQRWDPVFHANGIRYISETGDGGLYGVSSVNRFGPEGSLFYPNAYHLAGSLVHMLTGASVPVVLNGITMPLAGFFALSLVGLVRECGGRAVLAGSVAIVAATVTSAVHEGVAYGFVPFALSITLTPLGALAVHRFLAAPGIGNGIVLTLAAAGLLVVHSSALFAAVLFAVPLLIARWRRADVRVVADMRRLLPIVLIGGVLTLPQLLGALDHATGVYAYTRSTTDLSVFDALATLVTFQHARTEPQLLLGALLIVGVLTVRRLNGLRWVAWSAVLFGVLWMLVATVGGWDWVMALSRPWWNSRYRMLALVMIPLCLLVAHGLAELQRWLARLAAARVGFVREHPRVTAVTGLAAAVTVLVALGVATNGFYAANNTATVAYAYHNRPEDKAERTQPITVSPLQREAMYEMAELAVPGERVLNDRSDGSAWLYALTGVSAVAGHFDWKSPPADATYLAKHFNEYRSDPEVRAVVQRLNIHHVFIGSGLTFPGMERAPGLAGLDEADFVTEVYRNDDAVIYEITG